MGKFLDGALKRRFAYEPRVSIYTDVDRFRKRHVPVRVIRMVDGARKIGTPPYWCWPFRSIRATDRSIREVLWAVRAKEPWQWTHVKLWRGGGGIG